MGRIIGIDYGRKRTGIAVSDPLQIIASGVDTIATAQIFTWLEQYISREAVDRIIVGNPLMLDGSDSETTTVYVMPFVNRLKKTFPNIPVFLLDERFTSKIAVQSMVAGGMKKKDRRDKANIDKISATILLQDYLESKDNQICIK